MTALVATEVLAFDKAWLWGMVLPINLSIGRVPAEIHDAVAAVVIFMLFSSEMQEETQ